MSQLAESGSARAGVRGVRAALRVTALGLLLGLAACGGGGGDGGDDDGTGYIPGDGPGSALLAWSAPSERENGVAIAPAEIAGYRIHFGPEADPAHYLVRVEEGSQYEYTITGLAPDTWTFTVSAVDRDGQESGPSNTMTKVIAN